MYYLFVILSCAHLPSVQSVKSVGVLPHLPSVQSVKFVGALSLPLRKIPYKVTIFF